MVSFHSFLLPYLQFLSSVSTCILAFVKSEGKSVKDEEKPLLMKENESETSISGDLREKMVC